MVLVIWVQQNTELLIFLSGQLPEFTTYDTHFFANCEDSVESHAKTADNLGLDFPLIPGANSEVIGWLLDQARGVVPIALILDPSQCVSDIIHGVEVGLGGFFHAVLGEKRPDRWYSFPLSRCGGQDQSS